MTLTEAINKLNARKVFDETLAIPIEIVVGELISTKEELQWYREQDLIKRDDVVELLVQHIMLDDDIDEELARFIAENEYRRVPKAEYRGEGND